LPGAALVRAILRRTSALIKLDFPTFDRPANASSRRPSRGNPVVAVALVMNSAVTIGLVDPTRPPAYLRLPAHRLNV
jgi:hypothetical protein